MFGFLDANVAPEPRRFVMTRTVGLSAVVAHDSIDKGRRVCRIRLARNNGYTAVVQVVGDGSVSGDVLAE